MVCNIEFKPKPFFLDQKLNIIFVFNNDNNNNIDKTTVLFSHQKCKFVNVRNMAKKFDSHVNNPTIYLVRFWVQINVLYKLVLQKKKFSISKDSVEFFKWELETLLVFVAMMPTKDNYIFFRCGLCTWR